jgi:hypothetical protein
VTITDLNNTPLARAMNIVQDGKQDRNIEMELSKTEKPKGRGMRETGAKPKRAPAEQLFPY